MIPAPSMPPPDAALDEQKREEARRQADGGGAETLADGAELTLDAVSSGAIELAAQAGGIIIDATGAVLGATVEVAKVSLELVGGILGGLADL